MRAQSTLYFTCTGAMMPTLELLETSFIACPSRLLDEDSCCCHAWVLPLPKEGAATLPRPPPVKSTCCLARPWLQTYPCCKPCRAHGLDTCSLGLGRVFNHRYSRREICPPSRIEMRKACRFITAASLLYGKCGVHAGVN